MTDWASGQLAGRLNDLTERSAQSCGMGELRQAQSRMGALYHVVYIIHWAGVLRVSNLPPSAIMRTWVRNEFFLTSAEKTHLPGIVAAWAGYRRVHT